MTHHKLAILVAATALVFGAATPGLAIAQPVTTLPDGPVACAAFQRSANGSWTVLRQTMLHPNVRARLSPRTRRLTASRSPLFSTAIAVENM